MALNQTKRKQTNRNQIENEKFVVLQMRNVKHATIVTSCGTIRWRRMYKYPAANQRRITDRPAAAIDNDAQAIA